MVQSTSLTRKGSAVRVRQRPPMSYYCPVCRCHERGGAAVGPGSEKVEGAGLGLLEQPGSARFSPDPPSPPKTTWSLREVYTPLSESGKSASTTVSAGGAAPGRRGPAASCGSCPTVHRPQAEGDWLTSHLQLLPDAVRKTHTPGVPPHRGGDRTPRRCPPSGGTSSFSGVPAALPRSGRRPLLETGHRLRLGSRTAMGYDRQEPSGDA